LYRFAFNHGEGHGYQIIQNEDDDRSYPADAGAGPSTSAESLSVQGSVESEKNFVTPPSLPTHVDGNNDSESAGKRKNANFKRCPA